MMFKDIDPDKFRSGMRGVLALGSLLGFIGIGLVLAFTSAKPEVGAAILGTLGTLVGMAFGFFFKKEE